MSCIIYFLFNIIGHNGGFFFFFCAADIQFLSWSFSFVDMSRFSHIQSHQSEAWNINIVVLVIVLSVLSLPMVQKVCFLMEYPSVFKDASTQFSMLASPLPSPFLNRYCQSLSIAFLSFGSFIWVHLLFIFRMFVSNLQEGMLGCLFLESFWHPRWLAVFH